MTEPTVPGPVTVEQASPTRLWWQWMRSVTLGECVGFAIPGLVAIALIGAPEAVFVLSMLAAGALEGAVLGWAQSRILSRVLEGFPAGVWTARTSAAAVLAWSAGLFPSIVYDELSRRPVGILLPATVMLGLTVLLSIGAAQWTVLRGRVERATRWIWVTAAAWLAGLGAFAAVTSPLWGPGQSVVEVAAVGVLGGLVMAACMAAVTGLGVVAFARSI